MISIAVVTVLAMLALVTQAGVFFLQRAYPAQGKPVEVAGAILNVVDIGPRDAAGPPIVMIHGASSNLETMRQPLGDLLAAKPSGDPDRSTRPWLEYARPQRRFDAGDPGQDDR